MDKELEDSTVEEFSYDMHGSEDYLDAGVGGLFHLITVLFIVIFIINVRG